MELGEREKALDGLGMLMKTPYYLSGSNINPDFQSLPGNPSFKRLFASLVRRLTAPNPHPAPG